MARALCGALDLVCQRVGYTRFSFLPRQVSVEGKSFIAFLIGAPTIHRRGLPETDRRHRHLRGHRKRTICGSAKASFRFACFGG